MNLSKSLTMLRALIPSIIFNFKYLPFKQAVKLPVLIYKADFIKLKGTVSIESDDIYFGMIRMGFLLTRTYPNSGLHWCNEGRIIFRGKAVIKNDCYITCGNQGKIIFGDSFEASAGTKIVSRCGINFGKFTRLGWEVIIMDTNFHPLFDIEKQVYKKAFGPIEIGDYNWFATQCIIMPNVKTPDRCIFGARSIVTRGAKLEPFCVHGGSPLHVLSRNVMRDYNNDQIKDYSLNITN